MNFPKLPDPPFVAVIFSNQRTTIEYDRYNQMAERMAELAAQQPGYLGINSTRDDKGFGITVSYWQNESAAQLWREVAEHQVAQSLARQRWYSIYQIQICRVDKSYIVDADER